MGMQLPVLVRLRNRVSARRRVLMAAAVAFGVAQLLPQRSNPVSSLTGEDRARSTISTPIDPTRLSRLVDAP